MIFLPVLIFRSDFFFFFEIDKIPEESRRTYWPKHCGNNNKEEDNSPKILNDKNNLSYFTILEIKYRAFKKNIFMGVPL